MRILVVATQIRLPDTHGGSTHVGELVAHLRELGPVLALTKKGSTAEDTVGVSWNTGYPAVIKHLFPWAYLPRSLAAARRFRPDAIYERGSSYGLGAMLSVALGVPMLTMVLDEHYSGLSLRRARRLVSTNVEIVPAPHRDKAVKVSWGANTRRFHPGVSGAETRERYGFGDATVICYVGSFKRWHGLLPLVDAAELLAAEPLRYLMIGDGPLREEVEQRAASAGLSERFVFTGAVPYGDVPGLVAAADICLAPFEPELHPRSADGFILDPLKVFEYLAMAKPTITADTANIAALFGDGEHLRLVPSSDPQRLADTVRELMADPEGARVMAQRGYERVSERHTWAAHAAHLYQLFGEMIEESR